MENLLEMEAGIVKMLMQSVEGVKEVTVNIVFEPEWNQSMMSEEAKLELGYL